LEHGGFGGLPSPGPRGGFFARGGPAGSSVAFGGGPDPTTGRGISAPPAGGAPGSGFGDTGGFGGSGQLYDSGQNG
jgi:hypothetical protein